MATNQMKSGGQPASDWTSRIDQLVIAGWAGRDQKAVEAHIEELAELGVPRPKSTPVFYRVAASLLTSAPLVELAGDGASGEVEAVVFAIGGRHFVTVGSDHTDRALETVGVAISKQVCAKPVAAEMWPLEDVIEHWDQLIIRSWVTEGGTETLYQEGPLATNLAIGDLIGMYGRETGQSESVLADDAAMFCGTLPVIGAIRGGLRFRIELEDPVIGRVISHQYDCQHLQMAG